MFIDLRSGRREPILAAVGELQFDVVRFRLESEYNTQTDIEWMPLKLARWVNCDEKQVLELKLPYSAKVVRDQFGHHAVLFNSTWDADYAVRENPSFRFDAIRVGTAEEIAAQGTNVGKVPFTF